VKLTSALKAAGMTWWTSAPMSWLWDAPVFISVTRHSSIYGQHAGLQPTIFSIPVEQVVEVGIQLDL